MRRRARRSTQPLDLSGARMYDLTKLTRESGSTDWYCQGADGSELFVRGSEEGPNSESVADASIVVSQYRQVKEQAIGLLESFMKDRGKWFLNTVSVGPFAVASDGDFKVELGFESDANRYAYSYTGFTVYFTLTKQAPMTLRNKPHPFKFTVEFS